MSFLKDTIFYSSSTIITQIMALFRGVIIRIILIPEILGIYNFIQVIVGFISVIDFGGTVAASRELPLIRGSKMFEKENLIRSTVFWFTLLQSLLVALGTIIFAILFKENYSNWELAGFFIASLMLVLSGIYSSYQVFFQSAQEYNGLSKIILITGILELISFILGTYYFGIVGLLTSFIGLAIFKIIYFLYLGNRKNIKINFSFSFKTLLNLLKFGFPLRILDYPKNYMIMLDLLWVTHFMGIKSLAIYTTARMFYIQSTQIGVNMSTVFQTKIIQQYGSDKTWKTNGLKIKKYLYLQLLIVVPILIWGSNIFIPFIIRQVMPKYTDSIPAMSILFIANFFVVVNTGLTIPWFVNKQLIARGISNGFGFLSAMVSLIILWYIIGMKSIVGVAIAITVGSLLYFIYMIFFVGKQIWTIKQTIQVLFVVLVSAIWVTIIILGSNNYLVSNLNFYSDIIQTFRIGLITFVMIIPIILLGIKLSDYKGLIKALN